MATIRCRPDEPFSAFPSWFMRITCDRCGKDRVISETHASAAQHDMPIRETVKRMRHDGCGGRAGIELMTGIAIEAHFVRRKRTTIMEVARDALKIETPRLGTHDQRLPPPWSAPAGSAASTPRWAPARRRRSDTSIGVAYRLRRAVRSETWSQPGLDDRLLRWFHDPAPPNDLP